MTGRMVVGAAVGVVILSMAAPARSLDTRPGVQHKTIPLLQADARQVALMLGAGRGRTSTGRSSREQSRGAPAVIPAESRPDTSRRPQLVARAVAPRPGAWAAVPRQGPSGPESPFATGDLLPGEMGPPIAMPGQNALLVTGTPAEIDAFVEILRLLDVAPDHVRIRVDMVDVLSRVEEALGLDWEWSRGQVDAGTTGNVPLDASAALRLGFGDFAAALGAVQRQSRGTEHVGTEIVTMNHEPAAIQVGQSVPYFVPETVVTQGVVATNWVPYGAFVGVEMNVLPRINADDTVSMRIYASLIDETGTVVGPGGGAVPVTNGAAINALVRVPDGESACIGGLPRWRQSSNSSLGGLGTQQVTDSSELLVFVTPNIVRTIGEAR